MTVTKEILTVLADCWCPVDGLIYDDLTESLTQPKNWAHNWRNRVFQSVRTLIELGFLNKSPYLLLDSPTYKITKLGRAWLDKENK